jgi:hypothetical protein
MEGFYEWFRVDSESSLWICFLNHSGLITSTFGNQE